ncbi:MAG: c-type cytochrome [Croceibacterium sp.]
MTSRLAVAAALAFALAACGSDDAAEEAGDAAAEAVAAEDGADPAPISSEAVDPTASPAPDTSASASPSPTTSPTAARAAPSPTPVAAAGPPESFKQCAICHKVEPGQHGLGPSLAGVFGAKSTHAAGFNYSDAMEGANLTWNQATLDRYLANPQGVVPGTTMAFAGVKDAAKRAEIIAYLKTL